MTNPASEPTPLANAPPRADDAPCAEANRAFVRVLADFEREALDPTASAKVRYQAWRPVIEATAAVRRAVAQRQVVRPAKAAKPQWPPITGRIDLPPLGSVP